MVLVVEGGMGGVVLVVRRVERGEVVVGVEFEIERLWVRGRVSGRSAKSHAAMLEARNEIQESRAG